MHLHNGYAFVMQLYLYHQGHNHTFFKTSISQGIAHTVINWGPWAGDGMARDLSEDALSSAGIRQISPEVGARIISLFIQYTKFSTMPSQITCVALDMKKERLLLGDIEQEDQAKPRSKTGTHTQHDKSSTRDQYSLELVKKLIEEIVSRLLGDVPEASAPLMASGLDSLGKLHEFIKYISFSEAFS